jgi:hypothetical protein
MSPRRRRRAHAVAPVALGHVQPPARARKDRGIAERRQNVRPMPVEQAANARQIHVVVVVVADQHGVDARQLVEREAGRPHPLRPGPLHRAGAPGKERVGEDVEPADLDQRGRLADIGDLKPRIDGLGRGRLGRIVEFARPGLAAAGPLPFDQLAQAIGHAMARHEEPIAVIVVRRRALVIAVRSLAHRPHIAQAAGFGEGRSIAHWTNGRVLWFGCPRNARSRR